MSHLERKSQNKTKEQEPVFDPSDRFEATKFKNFQHSSRLEGIELSVQNKQESLATIIEKYRA